MTQLLQEQCLNVLRHELIPALGCTEPIAIALAAAKARKVLGTFPQHLQICCSGNIIKNVKGVTVPNSGGLKGIGAAAVLGCVGGDPDLELETLTAVRDSDIQEAVRLLKTDFFCCKRKENVDNLYIEAVASANGHTAAVVIARKHTNFVKIQFDDRMLLETDPEQGGEQEIDRSFLSMQRIYDFAAQVDVTLLEDTVGRQITLNSAISAEGLKHDYGARVGKTLMEACGDCLCARVKAAAAAGSDARMGGCSLPVVINSGSGNQGLTISMSVYEYSKSLHCTREQLYRGLALANLTAIHIKRYIGSLSAFCGAVSAAAAAGAGITYLSGGDLDAVSRTVVNALADAGGIVCDGAKASCAAKIATALDCAIMAHRMSMRGIAFPSDEGILQPDVEQTLRSFGHVAKTGMKSTDAEILRIMTGETRV